MAFSSLDSSELNLFVTLVYCNIHCKQRSFVNRNQWPIVLIIKRILYYTDIEKAMVFSYESKRVLKLTLKLIENNAIKVVSKAVDNRVVTTHT